MATKQDLAQELDWLRYALNGMSDIAPDYEASTARDIIIETVRRWKAAADSRRIYRRGIADRISFPPIDRDGLEQLFTTGLPDRAEAVRESYLNAGIEPPEIVADVEEIPSAIDLADNGTIGKHCELRHGQAMTFEEHQRDHSTGDLIGHIHLDTRRISRPIYGESLT